MCAKKFMLLLLLLAFVITCFIAAPVFSGNGDGYPWDADDTGTHDDSNDPPPDTTTSEVILLSYNDYNPDNDDLINGVASQFVFFIMNSFYFYQPDTYFIISETEGSNNEQEAVTKISAK